MRRNVRSCKAKLQTRDGIFVRSTNTHTCALFGHPEKVAVLKARAAMLLQAESTDNRTHAIIGANTQSLSDNIKAYLPNMEAMKRGIRRVREANNVPVPARDDRNFQIPNDFSLLIDGEQFLRYDNNNGEARVLIYGTVASISFLAHSDD